MKVHKTTYSIRKGFEYQDLYCAVQVFRRVEKRLLEFTFEIESDAIQFVDDLKIVEPDGSPEGHQVKHHTTLEAKESLESLTHTPRSQGRSLILKLYEGWRTLSSDGDRSCVLAFVSSSLPDRSLGRLIDTETGRFNNRLLTAPEGEQCRKQLCSHLNVAEPTLVAFLGAISFALGRYTIESLRIELSDLLRRLSLPSDRDSIAVLLDIVGQVATQRRDAVSGVELLSLLAERRTFRDACEAAFPDVIERVRGGERTSAVRVALISLEGIPAFAGEMFTCLEEAAPSAGDWEGGISQPILIGQVGQIRERLRKNYIAWCTRRVEALLHTFEGQHIDLLVFSRYSLPLDVGQIVFEWCEANKCNAVLGGHSYDGTSEAFGVYSEMGLRPAGVPDSVVDGSLVVDVVIRYGRGARFMFTRTDSPNSKKDALVGDGRSAEILTAGGWLSVGVAPSRRVCQHLFKVSQFVRPELLVCPTNMHHGSVVDTIDEISSLSGTPLFVNASRPDRVVERRFGGRDKNAVRLVDRDWEGAAIVDVTYERRTDIAWTAQMNDVERIPLVYVSSSEANGLASFAGLPRSVAEANQRQTTGQLITRVPTIQPRAFYCEQIRETEDVLRRLLSTARGAEFDALAGAVKWLEASRDAIDPNHEVRAEEPRQRQQQVGDRRPSLLVGRSSERQRISRFLDGTNQNRILVVHGPPGVGRRRLLADIQRTNPGRASAVSNNVL